MSYGERPQEREPKDLHNESVLQSFRGGVSLGRSPKLKLTGLVEVSWLPLSGGAGYSETALSEGWREWWLRRRIYVPGRGEPAGCSQTDAMLPGSNATSIFCQDNQGCTLQ